MRMSLLKSLVSIAGAIGLTACASSELAQDTGDPFEPANRVVFAFNEAVDDAIVGPTSRAYDAVTPEPVQTGVRNFMTNLNQPVVFTNAVLQGDAHAAGDTVGRFLMNTTLGIGGVFDVASREGVPEHRRDFGQTLARWGVADGPYIVMPLLGPSNVRDGAARFVDRYPHPLNWNADESGKAWAWGVRALNGIDARARLEETLVRLDRTAIDPYVQTRSAWRQARQAFINGETAATDSLDDLPEFE